VPDLDSPLSSAESLCIVPAINAFSSFKLPIPNGRLIASDQVFNGSGISLCLLASSSKTSSQWQIKESE
jgi:hypothetical protein